MSSIPAFSSFPNCWNGAFRSGSVFQSLSTELKDLSALTAKEQSIAKAIDRIVSQPKWMDVETTGAVKAYTHDLAFTPRVVSIAGIQASDDSRFVVSIIRWDEKNIELLGPKGWTVRLLFWE